MRISTLVRCSTLAILLSGCSDYYVYKGNIALSEGDLDGAERDYAQAPRSETARLNMAVIRIRQGRLSEAARLLEPLATTTTMDPPVVYIDPLTFTVSNSRDLARRNLSLVYSDLAAQQIGKGRYDDAFDLSQKAITADPGNLYAQFNLAVCVAKKGYAFWAETLYRKVINAPHAKDLKSANGQTLRAMAEAYLAALPGGK